MPSKGLEEFKTRRTIWIQCFNGEDPNSIMRQIPRMIWDSAAFRVVNEARRIAPSDEDGGVQLNGLMHDLIDKGFFESQLLAVRRLTDKSPIVGQKLNAGKKRDVTVCSLASLLDDMKQHVPLLTRENILAAEGLEYDIDSLARRRDAYYEAHAGGEKEICYLPSELDVRGLKARHREIDVFAGVAPDKRGPGDTVRTEVFEKLKQKLMNASKDLHLHVDKFIAHAATFQSRQCAGADETRITLGHLYAAQDAICKVAGFVGTHFLTRSSHSMLPVPQYDHLAYIDKPLVTTDQIGAIQEAWHAYHRATHEWMAWGLDAFREESGL